MIRFIPAPAGNMGKPGLGKFYRPVHPRACGEHTSWNYWQSLSIVKEQISTENLPGFSFVILGDLGQKRDQL